MPWSSSYRGGSSRVSCFECGGPHYVKNCPDWRARKQRKKAEGPGPTWTQYKVADLKRLCQERGLKVSGRKAELVKRLQEHFDGEQASRRQQQQAGCAARAQAATSAAAQCATAAPPRAAAKSDVSALFDLSDDEANDAAVANAVPTTKPAAMVVSRTPRAAIGSLSQSSTTSHGSLPSYKASRVFTASKAPIASGAVTPAAVGTFNAITPMPLSQSSTASNAGLSLSQLSQSSSIVSSSSGSKPQITDEQKERIRRSREEAQRRKKARLSAPSNGSNGKVGPVSVNPYGKKAPMNPYGKKPACNPYEKKVQTKRNEVVLEEDAMMGEIGGKLSKLPPLPPGAPPVREDTLQKLSEEQLEVIMMARPPDAYSEDLLKKRKTSVVDNIMRNDHDEGDEDDRGPVMVRVNAAAGTGKTTTLMHLATRLIDLGHESLTYVTFSRAAAKDAQERMQSQLDDEHKHRVSASTLHSCALRLLDEEANDSDEADGAMLGDMALKKLIGEKWGKALREYIDPALRHLKASMVREGEEDADEADILYKLDGKKKQLFDKAQHYLFKTFETFTRNDLSLEDLRDRSKCGRHFYPVCKKKDSVFHMGGDAAELGFPPAIYTLESSYSFFADTTVEIWDFVIDSGIRTFNIMIKKAQLGGLRVPGSAILVDESQDLDKSQVSWIKNQKLFGAHIFWVGDSAQCIYGFRGAKSKNVMGLECVDTKLTKSWRFGPEIAKVANIALFAKEKSIQTTMNTGKHRVWIPYRMEGARRMEGEEGDGVVTTESLLANWKDHRPLTLIGNTNAGLMIQALDLLGLGALKNRDADDASEDSSGDGVDVEMEGGASAAIDEASIPKFHIIGKGESSGAKKWRDAMWQVRHLYELYTNKDEAGHIPMSLPASQFREFADEGALTWGTFIELCKVKEITRFNVALSIIATYQQNTLTAMDSFESHVMGSNPADTADIILTTCHSAKGLEWDSVEIADDFYDLAAASFNHSDPSRVRHPSFLASMPSEKEPSLGSLEASEGERRKGWQFVLGQEKYEDQDINKLYVALTRARKTLSVPKSIKMLLKDMDVLHYLVESYKKDALDGDGSKRPVAADESTMVIGKSCKRLSKGDVWNLYHDLCAPLRRDMGIPGDSMMLPTLFPGCEDESMETEIVREQEGAQAELSSNRESIADLFDC